MLEKKLEKDANEMIDKLIWGAPQGSESKPTFGFPELINRVVIAKPLLRFWQKKFNLGVQGRNKGIDGNVDQGLLT